MHKNYHILAIESSCDETSAAVYSKDHGLLSNELFSQIATHTITGGVIPETAAQEHMTKIIPIVDQALTKANCSIDSLDAIAVTHKPGLPGALMVGVSYAKALAFAAQKPLIGVDHLEGHIFSACIENKVELPFICLTASGGHSAIYMVNDYGDYLQLGTTLDDAAGEAFDKIAKLLNLGYPGGPIIEKMAEAVNFQDFFNYPRGHIKDLNMSFSGLKTAVLYHLIKDNAYDPETKKFLKDDDLLFKQKVASSLLVCIGDIFTQRIIHAIKQYPKIQSVCFVGGVACNKYLRKKLLEVCTKYNKKLCFPSPRLCTDNAGMIAFVGAYKYEKNEFNDLTLKVLS